MPIFEDAYTTTAGSTMRVDKVEGGISKSLIMDPLLSSSLDVKKNGPTYPVFVTGVYDSEAEIPLFTFPILVKTRDGEKVLCADMRLAINPTVYQGNLANLDRSIKRMTDYTFTRSLEIATLAWVNGEVDNMKLELDFAGVVFSMWIAEVISKNYALDLKDQLLISIVCSYYYLSLFIKGQTPDEETRAKWVVHTIKATRADSATVERVFSMMGPVASAEDLTSNIKAVVQNVRLNSFNLVGLLTLIKNSWFGERARVLLSVAIEHPPTWAAIVYEAVNERTFRNSLIAKIAERLGKRSGSEIYAQNYKDLLQRYTVSESYRQLVKEDLL